MSHTVESQPERREFTLIMYLFMILAGLLVVGVFLWVMLQVFGPLIAFIGLVLTLIGGWFATQYGYERFVVGPRLDNELKQEQRDFQRMLTAGLGIAAQDPNANVRVSELPQGGRTYEIIRTLPENTHRPRVSVEEVEAPPEQKALPAPALPGLVRYEEIKHQIPMGQALLGLSGTGVETCDFEKLMTCWIVGGSSTGKSNTVALKIDEAIRNGKNIKLLVIDPHIRKPDSLYNKIKSYSPYFLFPVASKPEEVYDLLEWFLQEFDRRLETGGGDDLLLVVDEVSNVADMENPYAENKQELAAIFRMLKKVARICGQESRGFGMFGWFISQNSTGLAWLRDKVITVIAHKQNMMKERILACNENREIARDMDTWPKGRVLIYGIGFDDMKVLQQPLFTPPVVESTAFVADEMPALLPLPDRLPIPFPQRDGKTREDNGEAAGRSFTSESLKNPAVLKNFLSEAGKMRKNGASIDAILKEFGMSPGGRNNQNLKALLEEL